MKKITITEKEIRDAVQSAINKVKPMMTDEEMISRLKERIDRIIEKGGYQNDVLVIDSYHNLGLWFEYFGDSQTIRFFANDCYVPFTLVNYMNDTGLMASKIFDYYQIYKRTINSDTNMTPRTAEGMDDDEDENGEELY